MKYLLPCVATSFTGTPISWAINPTMLNMTKPAKKLVALFPSVITKESLENNINNKNNQKHAWKKFHSLQQYIIIAKKKKHFPRKYWILHYKLTILKYRDLREHRELVWISVFFNLKFQKSYRNFSLQMWIL